MARCVGLGFASLACGLSLLAGCQEGEHLPSCESTVSAVTSTCLSVAGDPAAVDVLVDGGSPFTLRVAMSGTVEQVGVAAEDTSCFRSAAYVDDRGSAFSDPVAYVSVRDEDGILWTLGSLLPGALAPFAVGDAVTAEFVGYPPSIPLQPGSLIVTRNGALAFWVGEAPWFDVLTQPPGYTLGEGPPICELRTDCGNYVQYELAVEGASSGSVRPSAPATIGSDLVINAGVELLAHAPAHWVDGWGSEASGAIL